MRDMIYTHNLTKSYQDFQAVDHVSLRVKKGEIYGFLGLNGAGKTTTIRMLLGMIQSTSGSCFINGQRVSAGNYHTWKQVGYMVETPYSYPELTVRENLELTCRLHRVQANSAVGRVIEQLKLTKYEHRKAKHLSMGNAQRLGIARALLHEPQVLLLDEPTNGLDPAGIVEIRELLQELASTKGTTIFISSHILGEISKIATKIGIIHNGSLIQELRKEELEKQRIVKLLINTRNIKESLKILSNKGYAVSENEIGLLEIQSNEAVTYPEELARILVRADHPPTMLYVDEEDLESYFLRIIGRKGGRVL
ncbi:ABC transporter ATP-binding protein [Virgibacillus ndiopensis]|uniref:ABC transporter ATP-binding protein n=1 Tax=Virgibacillus ndiopensis TaxID=2004408 RepID=UPI000C06A8CD|nr:ABC transporter ATP-binding protein [Virgibacillus ndiopensis]